MEFKQYILPLKRWWWLLVAATMIAAVSSYLARNRSKFLRGKPSVFHGCQITGQLRCQTANLLRLWLRIFFLKEHKQ